MPRAVFRDDRVRCCELVAVLAMGLFHLGAIALRMADGAYRLNIVMVLLRIAEMVVVLVPPIRAEVPAINAR